MKRLPLFFLAILGAFFTVFSCMKAPSLTLIGPNTFTFTRDGGEQSFNVSCNRDWSISSSESWLRVSPLSGNSKDGDVKVTITCASNTTFDSRSAAITVKAEDLIESIAVTQDSGIGLFVSPKQLVLTNEAQVIEIAVQKNVQYSISIDNSGKEWIKHIDTKALSSEKTLFSIALNDTYEEREGRIRFSDSENGLEEVVTVVQKQNNVILVTQNKYDVSEEGETITVEVKSNIDFHYEISEGGDWISEIKTKALSTHTLEFEVKANDTYEERQGKIRFSDNETGLEEVVTVIQKQNNAILVTQNKYDVSEEGETITVEVKSNIDFHYEISEGGDWISEIKTKALSTHTLEFEVKANDTYVERQGRIDIIDNYSGGKTSVMIIQYGAQHERKVLMEIFDACTDSSWKIRQNTLGHWGSDLPLEFWEGVTLNENGRVDVLELKNYAGNLPSSISQLAELKKIVIYCNISNFDDKWDTFPEVLCDCLSLEEIHITDASGHGISHIPESITNLKSLRILELSRCEFQVFPEILCYCTKLEELILKGISEMDQGSAGFDKIPASFVNLKDLKIIDFRNNHLSSFPDVLCTCTNLEEVDLGLNRMSGSLPSSIGNLKKLNYLGLYRNFNLSGRIPNELFSLPCWKSFPFDIISATKLEYHLSDLIAPSFEVHDLNGVTLSSNNVYRNSNLTILHSFDGFDQDVFEDLRRVYNDYPDEVNIISFSLDENENRVRTNTEKAGIPWHCVSLNTEYVISGQSGHYGLLGRRIAPGSSIMVVNSESNVVFYDGKETVKNIYSFISNNSGYYESKDYSQDGKVIELQKTTDGKGIDLVFMGDAYSDRFVADGTYLNDMTRAMEAFFAEEPYNTFRHLFNAYAVVAISKNDRYEKEDGTETVFDIDLNINGNQAIVCNNVKKVKEYAIRALDNSEERLNHSVITTVVRSNKGRSVCYMGNPYMGKTSLAFCVKQLGTSENYLESVVKHEAAGHGFGGLGDEYIDYTIGGTSTSENYNFTESHKVWSLMNLDTVNDPSKIIWHQFISDSRYEGSVGIYEGGNYISKGIFRPSEYSIMNSTGWGFNAPSREAIYYKIHKMAYGDDWEYDYEKFVVYDIKNIKKNSSSKKNYVMSQDKVDLSLMTAPPIIIY